MAEGVRVDSAGIRLPAQVDGALDVLFGDHRIWSFSTRGDGHLDGDRVVVPWPPRLTPRLDGVAQVSVVPHGGGDPLFSDEVRFGTAGTALELLDDAGNRLSVDKNGRLQRSFDRMDTDSRRELVAAARTLVDDLVERCDLDAYLAYGCLLGAVRDGHMIGHDSDVDLAYLSRFTHPFDIIREARKAERRIRSLGWKVIRFSAANFKVVVPLPSGKTAGVDVFGSFHVGDHFHVTGNLRGHLDRASLVPFSTVTLEGVEFPAPADPEAWLAMTYGPTWRTPDPSFHFAFPEADKQRMNQWLRQTRFQYWHWQPFYSTRVADRVPEAPSSFAAWVAERLQPGSRVVELGSGTGRDALWLAEQGFDVLGSDYSGAARSYAVRKATERGQDVRFRPINLYSNYSVLTQGARLAHQPGQKHVYARLLIDALPKDTRANLWRFCSMLGRSGGRTFLEFRTADSPRQPTHFGAHLRTYARPDVIAEEIEARGGRVVTRVEGRDLARLGKENPVVCRMEVSWTR